MGYQCAEIATDKCDARHEGAAPEAHGATKRNLTRKAKVGYSPCSGTRSENPTVAHVVVPKVSYCLLGQPMLRYFCVTLSVNIVDWKTAGSPRECPKIRGPGDGWRLATMGRILEVCLCRSLGAGLLNLWISSLRTLWSERHLLNLPCVVVTLGPFTNLHLAPLCMTFFPPPQIYRLHCRRRLYSCLPLLPRRGHRRSPYHADRPW